MLRKFVWVWVLCTVSWGGVSVPKAWADQDPDVGIIIRDNPGVFFDPDDVLSLPSDYGLATIASSRRMVHAKIRDWSDDLEEIRPRRLAYCGYAGLGSIVSPATGPWFMPLLLLEGLPSHLPVLEAETDNPRPLDQAFGFLQKLVPFTDDELKTVDRLKHRAVYDRSDRLRLFIDAQWFLMRVTNRLYEKSIEYHLKRTEGFWGFFRHEYEMCAALSTRKDRNQGLIRAGERVLAFYHVLERELTQE